MPPVPGLPTPVITMPRTISIGGNFTLMCASNGAYPEPQITWTRRGTGITQPGQELTYVSALYPKINIII